MEDDKSVAMSSATNSQDLPFTIAHKPVGKLLPSQFWPEKENPRRVGIAIAVKQISEVDIVHQTYRVTLRVYIDWPATESECKQFWMQDQDYHSAISKTRTANSAMDSFLEFQPWDKFSVKAQESELARPWTAPKLCWAEKHQRYFIKCNATFRCKCLEKFELQRFPCDIQNLAIRCNLGSGSHGDQWAQLVPIHTRYVICKIERKYSVLEEYTIDHDHIFTYFQNSDPQDSSVHCSVSSVRVVIKLQRKWKSYFYRIALILSSLAFASNAAFIIEPEDIADRIAFLSTMVLAGVAFMFVIFSTLPNIPYLTYMDIYNNTQFGYMLVLLFVVCSTKEVEDETINDAILYFSMVIWLLYHLVLVIWFYYGHTLERSKLQFNVNDFSSSARGLKTIIRENEPNNWKFGYRFPGASRDEMEKGPLQYGERLKNIHSKKKEINLDWNFESNFTQENLAKFQLTVNGEGLKDREINE